MNIKDPNRLMLSFSLFFPPVLPPLLCEFTVRERGFSLWRCLRQQRHHQAATAFLNNYRVTCIITYSVCIRGRFHCALFKSADLVEALHMPLSITQLCLWFLTLPEGWMTNGPTCDAFCVKVTMAITLELHAHVVDCPGVFACMP